MSHHQLLHEAHASEISFHGSKKADRNGDQDTNILLQLQKVKVAKHGGGLAELNVLWDGGSTLSFITFRQARKLKLIGEKIRIEIVKVGGMVEALDSFSYNATLVDKAGLPTNVTVLGIERISSDIKAVDIDRVRKSFKSPKAQDVDRPKEGEINCLLGYEYAAKNTKRIVQHVMIYHANINIQMEDFYSIERLRVDCLPRCGSYKCGQCHPGGKDMTLKEEREYNLIEEKLVYKPDQRKWEAGYPWIKDPRSLPDNKAYVLGTLKSTEKRLKRFPEHAKVYQNKIEDMIKKEAARKLTRQDMDDYCGPKFYISYHEVHKPESKSTPCRIFFNSSANFRDHILKECYAKGPDMLNNLLGVPLRFRERSSCSDGWGHRKDVPC